MICLIPLLLVPVDSRRPVAFRGRAILGCEWVELLNRLMNFKV